MIKINLLAEKKAAKAKAPSGLKLEGAGGMQSLLLVGIIILGFAVAAFWSWSVTSERKDWEQKHVAADAELERLKEIRAKGEEYKAQKALLARKIDLIKDLKKKQEVPVHILDQISKNLPDFLWLDRMSANNGAINIAGKATTYNAVSNFYGNLTASSYFQNVTLGKTFEVSEGVSFSLTCQFAVPGEETPAEETQG